MKSSKKLRLHLCHLNNPEKRLSVDWKLHHSPIAEKYFWQLNYVSQKLAVYNPDRFYNFPNSQFSEEYIVSRLNHCIEIINQHFPGTVLHQAQINMSQDQMNELHTYFEKYRGPLLDPNELYKNGPLAVKDAFDEFNLMIHRYEDAGFSNRNSQLGKIPPKIHLTFGLNEISQRIPLEDLDYEYFTFENKFGRWFINYCEVGKPLHDIWRDHDDHIGSEVVIPLRYFSADGLINFGPEVSREDHFRIRKDFYEWWDTRREEIERLGFEKYDPHNAVGSIPVADLDLHQPVLQDLSKEQIIDLLSNYQKIARVECLLLDAPRETQQNMDVLLW